MTLFRFIDGALIVKKSSYVGNKSGNENELFMIIGRLSITDATSSKSTVEKKVENGKLTDTPANFDETLAMVR